MAADPRWTTKGREQMPGIILEWLKQMNEKAEPKVIDTGTMFAEAPICRNCNQLIERTGDRLLGAKKARAWVHSHNKSTYCYGRGN